MTGIGLRLFAFYLMFRLSDGLTIAVHNMLGINVIHGDAVQPLVMPILFWHYLLLLLQTITLFALASWFDKRHLSEKLASRLHIPSKKDFFRGALILISIFFIFTSLETCLYQTSNYLIASEAQATKLFQEITEETGSSYHLKAQKESLFNIWAALSKIILGFWLLLATNSV